MIVRFPVLVLLSLSLLPTLFGPGGAPLSAQAARDDDFAEFEDDDSEFDFEVMDDEGEDDCECHVTH